VQEEGKTTIASHEFRRLRLVRRPPEKGTQKTVTVGLLKKLQRPPTYKVGLQERPSRGVLGLLVGPLCERAGFFNSPTVLNILNILEDTKEGTEKAESIAKQAEQMEKLVDEAIRKKH